GGSTDRAMSVTTTGPEAARASRLTSTTMSRAIMPMASRLRSIRPAGIEAPSAAGTTHRRCGPPGPLNDPRSIMSHGPVPTRRYGVTYGLLLLSPTRNTLCPSSCVIVPELSPCRTDDNPHCCAPASHDVHGTYRVITQSGFVVSGLPKFAGIEF